MLHSLNRGRFPSALLFDSDGVAFDIDSLSLVRISLSDGVLSAIEALPLLVSLLLLLESRSVIESDSAPAVPRVIDFEIIFFVGVVLWWRLLVASTLTLPRNERVLLGAEHLLSDLFYSTSTEG